MRPVYDFLIYRSSWRQRHWLWIDSICIDQTQGSGDVEKESQIPLMGRIFSGAVRVIAWLGDLDNAEETEELMLDLIKKEQETPTLGFRSGNNSPMPITEKSQSAFQGLATLLGNPWFCRMWVLQEVTLARQLTLMFGQRSMDWDVFSDFLLAVHVEDLVFQLQTSIPLVAATRRGIDMAQRMLEFREQGANNLVLSEVLLNVSALQATKAHDKIYGVLGLFEHLKDDILLRPQYELPVHEVYQRAMLHALQSSQPLALLPLAGIGRPRALKSYSWVPDFQEIDRVNFNISEGTDYAAGLAIQPLVRISDAQACAIEINGRQCDQIVLLCRSRPDKNVYAHQAELDILEELRTWMIEFDALCSRSVYASESAKLHETAWKTLAWYHIDHDFPIEIITTGYYPHFRWYLGLDEADEQHPYRSYYHNQAYQDKTLSDTTFEDRQLAFFRFLGHFSESMRDCCIALTQMGRLAAVSPLAKVGDQICVLWGARTPYLLRSYTGSNTSREAFELVGPMYDLTLMTGDAADEAGGKAFLIV
jgi:hypothetical protein